MDLSGIYPIQRSTDGSGAISALVGLNPALITAYYFLPLDRWKRGFALHPRTVTDYELEYILDSDGGRQVTDGVEYPTRKGDTFFRKPGQRTQAFMRSECICLIFSLHGKLPDLADYRINKEKPVQETFPNPAIESIPCVVETAGDEAIGALFERAMGAFVNPEPYAELLEKAILTELMYCILSRSAPRGNGDGVSPVSHTTMSAELIGRLDAVRKRMHENLSQRKTVARLAGEAGLSEAYFHKCFARVFGVTPAVYLAEVRIERARELLAATDLPVRTIALETGFGEDGYFYRFFAQKTGMTPGDFRISHRMPGL